MIFYVFLTLFYDYRHLALTHVSSCDKINFQLSEINLKRKDE